MPDYKHPGIYVEETSLLPPAVAEVESAIPAFIGYTEKASETTIDDLLNKPTRINSMAEYERFFGRAHDAVITARADDDGNGYSVDLTLPKLQLILHYCMRLYFANGGGSGYVVSVGNYTATVSHKSLLKGIAAVGDEDEPTLLLMPEAVNIAKAGKFSKVVRAMLKQCGDLGDRFSIFDIRRGVKWLNANKWSRNRDLFGNENLRYGAAYYPFMNTSLNYYVTSDTDDVVGENVKITYPTSDPAATEMSLSALKSSNPILYKFVRSRLKKQYVVLPPSAAIAGAYVTTDHVRGVWKAPANVALKKVKSPTVVIDSQMQEGMNIDPGGKSVNAIRSFVGKGNLVWGARTLAGNDNEWRYVSVRRFFNTIEESVKKSTAWVVFEPNDVNTWTKVRSMIENYLLLKWRAGALGGTKPEDAFFVRCGLGMTMTSQDILEGRLIVEIGMAVVRPAEFIILRFFHKVPTR